jgi:long-chain acyl-CoA synthetase
MEIDLELYRREAHVTIQPPVRLSVIDIAPDFSQRTLVFLHGFGGQAKQWRYQLYRFSISNRVIAPDLRGHGRSDKPRLGYRMTQIQADLMNALDVLGVTGQVVLVGHSFGGAVAAEFAAAHPERVSHLVLIATAGEFKLNRLYRLLLRLPSANLQALAPFTRNWLGAPPQVLKEWHEHALSTWNGWELFRSLQMPTLVVRGHQDRVFEKPLFEEVARLIPQVEDIDVGASGHMVMLERREAVNRAISRFLKTEVRAFSQIDESADDLQRADLVKERPWLAHYDKGVPYTIAVPRVPVSQLLRSAARRFPSQTALVFEGRRISYRRLEAEANRFAHFLLSLNIQKGDRVMLILPNIPQLVIAYFGVLRAGAVAVFTLPTNPPEELVRQLCNSGASILVTLTQFDDLILQIKTQLASGCTSPLKHIIFAHLADDLPLAKRLAFQLSPEQRRSHLLDIPLDANTYVWRRSIPQSSPESLETEVAPDDLAVIQYTGGTTSQPKGVMLSHRNLVANALQTRHWMAEAQEGKERFLSVLPFSHSYGLTAALNVPVALGATMILKARFQVEDILQTIQKQRPTVFPGVPQMYIAIEDFPGVRKYGISSIKACISGSAPLPVEVQESFEKLTHGRLVEGYGLTEAGPVTHANPLNGLRKVGSIGIPLPSTQARLVDLRRGQKVVSVGQIGELAVRGPQVMLGYWDDPESTRQILSRDGWLLTGDVAQMDGDGYFRIIARKADMWYPSRPGKPAFPRDLEEVLVEIPQIKEAAVVAIAHQPIAFVIVKKDPPSAEAIIAYCKRRLPPELVPRLVVRVDDFPRTFIGKVLRRELARRFEENPPLT